jgi:hypothetical protein
MASLSGIAMGEGGKSDPGTEGKRCVLPPATVIHDAIVAHVPAAVSLQPIMFVFHVLWPKCVSIDLPAGRQPDHHAAAL